MVTFLSLPRRKIVKFISKCKVISIPKVVIGTYLLSRDAEPYTFETDPAIPAPAPDRGIRIRASRKLSRLQLRIPVKCPCDSGSGLRLDTPMMALHGKNGVESINLILGLLQSFSEIDAPAFTRKAAVVYLHVTYIKSVRNRKQCITKQPLGSSKALLSETATFHSVCGDS